MAALVILSAWLVLFFLGTALAARTAGRPVWLFGAASGRARLAAIGFRLAFTLALAGPLLWLAWPYLGANDPLSLSGWPVSGAIISAIGAGLALLAQARMGASWRVGISKAAPGSLVTSGLFRLSRNPVFLGQAILLAGVAIALPATPTLFAFALFLASATLQIREEERLLSATYGPAYTAWAARTPRWLLI